MGLKAAIKALREPENNDAADSEAFADFLAALNGNGKVTREIARDVPGCSGAVEFIAAQAAGVPFRLYEMTETGPREVTDDVRTHILNGDTNDLMDATSMKEALYMDYLYEGNGYAYISRAGNRVDGLYYVDQRSVAVNKGTHPIYKQARFLVQGQEYYEFDFLKLCRHTQDGVTGHGLLEEQGQILALAWAGMVLQTNLMKSGGNKRGFLSSEKRLSQQSLDALKESFERMYSNTTSGAVVLNSGVSFKEASNTSVELQLNETNQAVQNTICTAIALPPEAINGKGTEETLEIAVQQAVIPLLTKMEAALNRDLLLEEEKGRKYWKADTFELLKGNMAKRYEAYKRATEGGWIDKNEIRRREQMEEKKGLDIVGLGLGEVLLNTKTGQYFTPNTKTVTDLNGASRVVDGAEGVGGANGDAGSEGKAAPHPSAAQTPSHEGEGKDEGLKGGEGE